MGKLVFIPSYNDCRQAYNLYKQTIKHPQVTRVLIIDDSDTQECREYYTTRDQTDLTIIQGTRHGKWAAWRKALEIAESYDAVIQLDSDIEIETLDPIIEALESHEIVTTHTRFRNPEGSWIAQQMTMLYRRSHEQAWRQSKINMGGGVIALTNKPVKKLREHGFFNEPVTADDHIIALAVKSMGYRFKTVDCGVTVRLPDNTWEWILFKSRHVGAVSWAREYVKTKLPDKETVEHISKTDYQYTANIFLKTLLGTNPLTILVFTAITLASLLPLEDKHKWRRLKSTKLYFFYLLGATPWG